MSLNIDMNFIARWDVKTIALSWLMDGRPNRMLYEVLVSITNYRILNVLLVFPLLKVVEFDVASSTNPLTREVDHMIVIRCHLCLGYPHLFESFPVEDIHRTSLVYPRFHDGESVDVDRYHHGVVLRRVDTPKVFVGEGDG